jgi:biopolymer transport protein ExbD
VRGVGFRLLFENEESHERQPAVLQTVRRQPPVRRRHRRDEEEPGEEEIMIVPLVDIVFLLLIFFMITTVFKNPAQLKMTLPDAYNPMKLDKKLMVVELDAEGTIQIDGKPVTFDSFDSFLVNEKQKTGQKSIVIRADKAARHGDVLKLMRLAKAVAIETIALSTENKGVEKEAGPGTAFDRARAKKKK